MTMHPWESVLEDVVPAYPSSSKSEKQCSCCTDPPEAGPGGCHFLAWVDFPVCLQVTTFKIHATPKGPVQSPQAPNQL